MRLLRDEQKNVAQGLVNAFILSIPIYIIIALIILWALPCRAAEEIHWNTKQNWKTSDTVLSVVAVALGVIDWRQTREIAQNPGTRKEMNPILGPHPSLSAVDIYFPVTMLAAAAVSYFVPEWRPYILGGWIALEGSCTYINYDHGLKPW